MSVAAPEPKPEPAAAAPSKSAKRKSHAEIEIDLSLPEPPSKRIRRAFKKGKTPSTEKRREDNADLEGDEAPGVATTEETSDGNNGNMTSKKRERGEHAVWIGNLPFEVTTTHLKKWLVDNSGGVISEESITRVHMPKGSKGTSREKEAAPANKGFAHVDFDGLGPKVAAIALSENDLGGRRLLIKDSTSFEGRPAKTGDDGDKENGTGDKDGRAESRKLFVGNLSFDVTEDDVWAHFEKCGEIDWVKLATFEDTGKCKGYGWVKFREAAAAAWGAKGFVMIKEPVETEEDFAENDGAAKEGDGDHVQKFKTRKWWVNRLRGRELKLELAEDDQVRYQKRFGKDAKISRAAAGAGGKDESGKKLAKKAEAMPEDAAEA